MAMSEAINLVKLRREEQRSRLFYLLLLLSPFITFPLGIAGLIYVDLSPTATAPLHMRMIGISAPSLIYGLMLFGWLSPHRYVRRHMQQALFLAGLRLAFSLLSLVFPEANCLPSLINGSLWLFGSIWGWQQVTRGDCWLMRQLGEGDQLPRPWAKAQPGPVQKPPPAEWLNVVGSLDGQEALSRAQFLLERHQVEQAVVYLTAAFRTGPTEVKQQTLARLEAIGEVELF
jgi:hypothetical protein